MLLLLGIPAMHSCGGGRDADRDPQAAVLGLASIPRNFFPGAPPAHYLVWQEFLKQNPGIRYEQRRGLALEGHALTTDLLAMAGGVAPSVLQISFDRFLNYIDQGFLEPLDDWLEPGEDLSSEFPDDVKALLKGPDGRTYGILQEPNFQVLIYRKDILRDHGLVDDQGEARPPENWDELIEYCKILYDADYIPYGYENEPTKKGRHGFALHYGGGSVSEMMLFIRLADGRLVRKNKEGAWELALDEPKAVEGIKFYHRLCNEVWRKDGRSVKGYVRLYESVLGGGHRGAAAGAGRRNRRNDFRTGNLVMYIEWFSQHELHAIVNIDGINLSDLGIALIPAGPRGTSVCPLGGWIYGINSQVPEAEKRLAMRYLRFLNSDRRKKIEVDTDVLYGRGIFVKPHRLRQFGYHHIADLQPENWAKLWRRIDEITVVDPVVPGFAKAASTSISNIAQEVQKTQNLSDAKCMDIIRTNQEYAARHIFGRIPETTMVRYRKFAFVFLLVAVVLIVIKVRFIVKMIAGREEAAAAKKGGGIRLTTRLTLIAWMFMAPALLFILLWQYIPLGWGILMTFTEFRLLEGLSNWIGLDNFIRAFADPMFWKTLRNTVEYVGLTLTFGFFAPIVLAIFVTEIAWGRVLFRTIYYLPAVSSPLIIMFLWKEFYDPAANGALNQVVGTICGWLNIDYSPLGWLTDPKMAMLCIIIPGIWSHAGAGSLIYIAGLKAVSDEMYEAAAVDGAGLFNRFANITIPTLKPLIIINFVGAFIGAFHAMQNVLVMTGGGPIDRTRTIGMEIWFNAFLYLKFGYAAAMGWILGSMLIGFTLIQLRILKKVEFKRAEGNI